MPRPGVFLAVLCLSALAASCSQESSAAIYPTADLRPPGLVAAGPSDSRSLRLSFDEAVRPVEGSFSLEPPASLSCSAQDKELLVSLAADQAPGADYALAGEVDDLVGNRTRFLLRFAGWNGRAPPLAITEVQTGKNDSKANTHRDYVELQAQADGNLGGEELSWASSVKAASYRFRGMEVRKGDYIVLHLAPEGIAEEKDELGTDLAASGGIDASATGRDLWCPSMALPDESGAIALSPRPGDKPLDGFFYAASTKSGALGEDDLSTMVSSLVAAGAWPSVGDKPSWDDAYKWKSSPARSLCRTGAGRGPAAWYLTSAGGQSPGGPNSAPDSGGAAKSPGSRKASKKSAAKKP